MSNLQYQMLQMLEGLQRPEGILCIFLFLLMGVMTVALQWMRWVLLALMLWVCTFGISMWTGSNFAFPLQQIRSFGRGICGVLLVMLLIPTLRSNRGWRSHLILGGLLGFFGFQMVSILRILFAGDFARGYFGVITYSLTLITLGVGMSRWLQRPEHAIAGIRALAAGAALFCTGSLYQWLVNPGQAVWAGRFIGTTGNANHTAMVLGVAIPPIVYLFLRSGSSLIMRGLTAALAATCVLLLLWTGSRTGFVTALFGLVLLFRLRLGKLTVAIVCCGVFAFIGLTLLDQAGIVSIAGRLLSFDDTRSVVWASMFEQFKSSPLLGVNQEQAAFSENSYLLVLARTGILGACPFIVACVLMVAAMVRLQRLRPYLGEHVLLADLTTAGLCAIAVGGMFEGYLYATYSYPLFAVWIYGAIMLFLIDYGRAMAYQMQYAPQEWEAQWAEGQYEEQPAHGQYSVPHEQYHG
ncbi:MAG TPA: O-antigen ligase family protein [Tepidisphaeraceae bacterium]|jgi:hypothetical protein